MRFASAKMSPVKPLVTRSSTTLLWNRSMARWNCETIRFSSLRGSPMIAVLVDRAGLSGLITRGTSNAVCTAMPVVPAGPPTPAGRFEPSWNRIAEGGSEGGGKA